MLITKPHTVGQRASMPDYSQTIRDYAHGGKAPEADPFASFLTQIEQSNPSPEANNSSAYIDTHLGLSPYAKSNIEAGLQGSEESYRQSSSTIPNNLQSITEIAPADISAQILRANQQAEQSIENAKLSKEINDTFRNTQTIQDKYGVKIAKNQGIELIATEQNVKAHTSDTAPTIEQSTIRGIALKQNNGIQLFDTPSMGELMRSAIPLDSSSLNTLSRVEIVKAKKLQNLEVNDAKMLERKANQENIIENKQDKNKTEKNEIINNDNESLGDLSAKYESGSGGSLTIGYDRMGGTSYGKYQIASNTGSFDAFLTYLRDSAPDIAKELEEAGDANTGSKSGAVPEKWKEIAQNDAERFDKLQEGFIKQSHFDPAISALEQSGLDTESSTLKQVVWSTAVQHGVSGAKKIFSRALENLSEISEKDFITNVYDIRAKQFASSTASVREAVQSRLENEKKSALTSLG